ncbi:hypothetical protein BdWA1_000308 [Babesia duncani]|uniref:Uncharacterized protein n=1 Tax=Babesia duncani TaxID=323732 RepID=A0AAD9PLZ6_9APIC|nr:hypothetical protein BdWA1_000308 [Babesia duncani]
MKILIYTLAVSSTLSSKPFGPFCEGTSTINNTTDTTLPNDDSIKSAGNMRRPDALSQVEDKNPPNRKLFLGFLSTIGKGLVSGVGALINSVTGADNVAPQAPPIPQYVQQPPPPYYQQQHMNPTIATPQPPVQPAPSPTIVETPNKINKKVSRKNKKNQEENEDADSDDKESEDDNDDSDEDEEEED